jgi:hypothetical protein
MALVLHEARALIRKAEKGLIKPEKVQTGPDGHFLLYNSEAYQSDDQHTFVCKSKDKDAEDRPAMLCARD